MKLNYRMQNGTTVHGNEVAGAAAEIGAWVCQDSSISTFVFNTTNRNYVAHTKVRSAGSDYTSNLQK